MLATTFFNNPELFVSVKEAAALLKKADSTVRRWAQLNLVEAITVGRTIWIYRPSLDKAVR